MLVLPAEDTDATPLAGFCFVWRRDTVALPLGYGPLYNHSDQPNREQLDRIPQTKVFRALRDIQPGEELTINYSSGSSGQLDLGFEILEVVG